MQKLIRDSGHLIRPAIVLLAGLGLFMVIRGAVVPKGFGQYGHYRGGALADVRSKPVVYAGRAACVECHTEEGDRLKGGKHKGIGCESCHGALAKHAADPSSLKPAKPDPKTHMDGGLCTTCHDQHAPDKEPKK